MKYFVRAVVKTESYQETKKSKGYLVGRLGKKFLGLDVELVSTAGADGAEYNSLTERGAQALHDLQKNWDTFK